jgi:NADH:ubiquinone oxidoreductase subunit K
MKFAFTKKNYIMMLIGIGLLILGFVLMSGGGTSDPNEFNEEIFSTRRITIAPMTVVAGYIVIGYAIMFKDKNLSAPDDLKKN